MSISTHESVTPEATETKTFQPKNFLETSPNCKDDQNEHHLINNITCNNTENKPLTEYSNSSNTINYKTPSNSNNFLNGHFKNLNYSNSPNRFSPCSCKDSIPDDFDYLAKGIYTDKLFPNISNFFEDFNLINLEKETSCKDHGEIKEYFLLEKIEGYMKYDRVCKICLDKLQETNCSDINYKNYNEILLENINILEEIKEKKIDLSILDQKNHEESFNKISEVKFCVDEIIYLIKNYYENISDKINGIALNSDQICELKRFISNLEIRKEEDNSFTIIPDEGEQTKNNSTKKINLAFFLLKFSEFNSGISSSSMGGLTDCLKNHLSKLIKLKKIFSKNFKEWINLLLGDFYENIFSLEKKEPDEKFKKSLIKNYVDLSSIPEKDIFKAENFYHAEIEEKDEKIKILLEEISIIKNELEKIKEISTNFFPFEEKIKNLEIEIQKNILLISDLEKENLNLVNTKTQYLIYIENLKRDICLMKNDMENKFRSTINLLCVEFEKIKNKLCDKINFLHNKHKVLSLQNFNFSEKNKNLNQEQGEFNLNKPLPSDETEEAGENLMFAQNPNIFISEQQKQQEIYLNDINSKENNINNINYTNHIYKQPEPEENNNLSNLTEINQVLTTYDNKDIIFTLNQNQKSRNNNFENLPININNLSNTKIQNLIEAEKRIFFEIEMAKYRGKVDELNFALSNINREKEKIKLFYEQRIHELNFSAGNEILKINEKYKLDLNNTLLNIADWQQKYENLSTKYNFTCELNKKFEKENHDIKKKFEDLLFNFTKLKNEHENNINILGLRDSQINDLNFSVATRENQLKSCIQQIQSNENQINNLIKQLNEIKFSVLLTTEKDEEITRLNFNISRYKEEWVKLSDSYENLICEIKNQIRINDEMRLVITELQGKIDSHNQEISGINHGIKNEIDLLARLSLGRSLVFPVQNRDVVIKTHNEAQMMREKIKRIDRRNEFKSATIMNMNLTLDEDLENDKKSEKNLEVSEIKKDLDLEVNVISNA